jgi:adenylate cyclase class IV
MPSNIEIKARVRDWDELLLHIAALTEAPPELLEQDDTFYSVPCGRLKLRLFTSGQAELIYYQRSDGSIPRPCDYMVVPAADPVPLQALLAAALGVRGRVRKRRWLYRVGQTRMHLDEVEGLGRFMELEYVLRPGEPHGVGLRAVAKLQAQLGITDEDRLDTAYIDLQSSPR